MRNFCCFQHLCTSKQRNLLNFPADSAVIFTHHPLRKTHLLSVIHSLTPLLPSGAVFPSLTQKTHTDLREHQHVLKIIDLHSITITLCCITHGTWLISVRWIHKTCNPAATFHITLGDQGDLSWKFKNWTYNPLRLSADVYSLLE